MGVLPQRAVRTAKWIHLCKVVGMAPGSQRAPTNEVLGRRDLEMRGTGFKALQSGSTASMAVLPSLPALCFSHTRRLSFSSTARACPRAFAQALPLPGMFTAKCRACTFASFMFLLKSHLLKEICPDHQI